MEINRRDCNFVAVSGFTIYDTTGICFKRPDSRRSVNLHLGFFFCKFIYLQVDNGETLDTGVIYVKTVRYAYLSKHIIPNTHRTPLAKRLEQ